MSHQSSKPCAVIDLGSAWVRCGFSGESQPRRTVRSPLAGRPRTLSRQAWVDLLSPFLCKTYAEYLQCKPKERSVFVSESMACPRALREAIAETLFEHLQVPSLCMSAGPAPALYCTGAADGIVIDIGESEAHVLAVYRGVPLLHTYTGD
jgi:actin-related protein 10